MRRRFGTLGTVVGLLLTAGTMLFGGGCRAARGADPLPSPLVGTWVYAEGAQLTATCGPLTLEERLAGATVAIRRDDSNGVWFDVGCRCHLHLTPLGSDAGHVSLAAPAECTFVYETVAFDILVKTLTLDLDAAGGTVRLDLSAGSAETPTSGVCESSVITANLTRVSPTPTECGPDGNALGVIPYDVKAQRSCPLGAGREGLLLASQDDDQYDCLPPSTGWGGESQWALPQAAKRELRCGRPVPARGRPQTQQWFCRVDGRPFKPLTTDPQATDQFYAVLKLSDDAQPCPKGSVEMVRRMDTEDVNNKGRTVGAVGPNQVLTAPDSNATILHFCFFRWADDAADTMQEFPDLGFPYAVYHDFDGPQPPWVTLKRTHHCTNEQNTNGNRVYSPALGVDDQAIEQFKQLVEAPQGATVFDMAWVR